MSPLKVALLLRMLALPRPNNEIPDKQAHAPAMHQAIADFKEEGLVPPSITAIDLQFGPPRTWLTEKGTWLANHILRSADGIPPALETPTRSAPPMPKIKAPRPTYEEMLRDDFATAAMQAAAANPTGADGFTFLQRAEWAYQQADAMLEVRNANR